MIERAVGWLEKHRAVNLLLVLVYIGFLLFAHDVFVNISVAVMNHFSIPVYEKLVAAMLVFIVLGAVSAGIYFLRTRTLNRRLGVFLALTLLLLVVHFFVLTEMNVEFIHAFMYGGLALLLFPLVGRFGGAVVLGLPVMLVDEWYQYIILFPDYVHFFEWNDIVLDVLGAGLFVAGLGVLGIKSNRGDTPIHKRAEVWLLTGFVLITGVLLASCAIVPYAVDSCTHTWFVMNTLPEMQTFWYVHPAIGSTLHVLKPMEGIVVVFLLCVFYLGMDMQGR